MGETSSGASADRIHVVRAAPHFQRWPELLALLHAAFAFQHGRIDPPSSLHRLDAAALAAKVGEETLLLALAGEQLLGCIFTRPMATALYVGKFAVVPQAQGQGIGRRLMDAVERLALEAGLAAIELETRIELVENHATFRALGFQKVAEKSHPGYDRPTSITMRKLLASARG